MKNGGQMDQTLIKGNNDKEIQFTNNSKLPDYQVQRQVLLQDHIHKLSGYEETKTSLVGQIRKTCGKFNLLKFITQIIPVLGWLPKYSLKNDFCGDLSAGITVAVMHIPQGMAYGLLAGVHAKVGLYMAFFPTLTYFIFGTSRHNSMGTLAVISIMVAKIVATHSPADPIESGALLNSSVLNATMGLNGDDIIYTPLQIVTAVSFCTSIIYIGMFLLHLGTITSLLSEPLVSGFIVGASVHVFSSQLKDIFGIALPRQKGSFKVILLVRDLIANMGSVNYTALMIAIITILYMIIMTEFVKPWLAKKTKFPLPIELGAVIAGTASSYFLGFRVTNAVQLVGDIPVGLPEPVFPPLKLVSLVAIDCISVAIVSYSIVISMGLLFAKKRNYTISANQELLALGAANMIGSLFSCIPLSASLSRTAIQDETGGKTQVASVVSASIILCVLLWIGPIFETLPRCVLAGIIVVALKGIYMQAAQLKRFYKDGKSEAAIWLISFLGVVVIDIDIGLLLGVITSVIMLYVNGLKSYSCVLGQISDTGVYVDLKNHKNAEEIANTKIFRYCGSINFATRSGFRTSMYKKINITDKALKSVVDNKDKVVDELHGLKTVILDLSCTAHMDSAGCNTLSEMQRELDTIGSLFLLACPSDDAYKALEHGHALGQGPFNIFPTIHDAVLFSQGHDGREEV